MNNTATTNETARPRVASREVWLEARLRLLERERQATHLHDELAAARRELPWVRLEKDYTFDTPNGKRSLADLFACRSQLIVYHFMFAPDWDEGCRVCSMIGDSIDGFRVHLAQRDVTLAVVSRAPVGKLTAFKERMGWRFPWVSSFGTEFNRDFGVSFTAEEVEAGTPGFNFGTSAFPVEETGGLSVFARDPAGAVYHTYSCYARGCEMLLPVYHYLDLVPKGRDEAGLEWPTAWVRHHDRYDVE